MTTYKNIMLFLVFSVALSGCDGQSESSQSLEEDVTEERLLIHDFSSSKFLSLEQVFEMVSVGDENIELIEGGSEAGNNISLLYLIKDSQRRFLIEIEGVSSPPQSGEVAVDVDSLRFYTETSNDDEIFRSEKLMWRRGIIVSEQIDEIAF